VDGFDDAVIAVAECLTDILDALDQRVVGAGGAAPDRFEQLLLGDESACVLDQVAEDVEGLRPQLDLLAVPKDGAARPVEDERIELQYRHARDHLPARSKGGFLPFSLSVRQISSLFRDATAS